MIGDSLTSDIKGGENANVDNCWYNPAGLDCPSWIRPTYTVESLESIKALLLEQHAC